MYECQMCGAVVPPRTPCTLVVLRRKQITHPRRPKVNKKLEVVKGKLKELWFDDPGGPGFQIEREVRCCPACAKTI